jgi:heat-inducible transcriptional repressor
MADLEELGLVHSPHTSAGRVPTVQGYRLFVDTLLQINPPQGRDIQLLREQLAPQHGRDMLLESASSLLSEITHLAGIVTLRRQEHDTLRQVEFLPLSDNRILVILVVNEQEVQNRVINTDRNYSPAELTRAANYLNSQFAGRGLSEVHKLLIEELRGAREQMNQMMVDMIAMAEKALAIQDQDGYVMAGQTNLMEYGELGDMERLRDLFNVFSSKRDLLHLLDKSLTAGGVQIFIGEESGYDILDNCSVVASPYDVDGEVVGVLGVIGPTRMAYERVIPIVDVTARLLGSALNHQQ